MGVDPSDTAVTRLLAALEDGEGAALDDLFSALYDELWEVAHRQRLRWRGNHTLTTTAIVHEAYVKLVGQARIGAGTRAHFLALAARAMRHVLCNYARDRSARKRGGGLDPVSLEAVERSGTAAAVSPEPTETLIELDRALRRLESLAPRRVKVVECRFFGGLTVEETAATLGLSPRTVERDWAMAQAWLYREMTGGT